MCPCLALTLWSENYDDFQLRQIAEEVTSEIEKVKDVSITKVIGGQKPGIKSYFLTKIKWPKMVWIHWESCK